MIQKFKKRTAPRRQRPKKGAAPPPKRPASPPKETPVTRVGTDRDHHDTVTLMAVNVLVDHPITAPAPEDSIELDRVAGEGSEKPGRVQRFPLAFTSAATPLLDSDLVSVVTFENVPDKGNFTLKLDRGESSASVTLFAEVGGPDLVPGDLDFIFDSRTLQTKDVRFNKRWLDYQVIPDHPVPDDPDLGSPEGPHVSLRE